MQDPMIPTTEPQLVAPDTHLITNLAPSGPGVFVPFNSYLIAGREPVIVDTGLASMRENWFRQVESLVPLEEVRWIFISHDDTDHVGNLPVLLERCPQATVVANFFITERINVDTWQIPLQRMKWLEAGETFRAGDRTLRLFTPPIYDGVTTRGLFDESTGAMWTVDSFAALTTGAVHRVDDLPKELYDESFELFQSMVSPWREWLDRDLYGRHVTGVEALGPIAVASAHGPILTGDQIPEAYDRVRSYAGTPRSAVPGSEVLEEMLQAAAANFDAIHAGDAVADGPELVGA